MNNLKIVIANPVTKGDWMELLSGLLGLPNDGGLSIAAWALGLEPEDLQFLLWDAQYPANSVVQYTRWRDAGVDYTASL